uniref:Uncharacterized protein n=1 Tax=Nelumbo nucifera TaxID=4432 RepID=A0A822XGS2_NELNU|nr:TPA_asm: hypothetical protein HUJ06_022147 [Nelumbo nucifera]
MWLLIIIQGKFLIVRACSIEAMDAETTEMQALLLVEETTIDYCGIWIQIQGDYTHARFEVNNTMEMEETVEQRKEYC